MSLNGVVQYSSLRVVSSSNASSKRVAEVKEVSAGLQESQDCKKNCPGRQQRVLHVSEWRSSVFVFTRRLELKRVDEMRRRD